MTMRLTQLDGEGIIVTPRRIRLTAAMAGELLSPGTMIEELP
jgi:hypothetical protein